MKDVVVLTYDGGVMRVAIKSATVTRAMVLRATVMRAVVLKIGCEATQNHCIIIVYPIKLS